MSCKVTLKFLFKYLMKFCTRISGAEALAVNPTFFILLRYCKSNFSIFSVNMLFFAPYCFATSTSLNELDEFFAPITINKSQ